MILVTGGTGSFGRAFTENVLKYGSPKVIRIYSRDELKQLEMSNSLNKDDRLRFFIGDVRDGARLQRACEGVDFLIHAAAMKQIPACEYNPIEAIRTNIDGSINVIDASLDNNIPKVIALSSDKAVHPVNLYGATKLCAEKLFINANNYIGAKRDTKFSVVRYGNVLASRGSVIPVFKEQIARGEKLAITDKRMTRFWITLEQAVQFVASSFKIMNGGEIFIPKIPSMRLVDLAKAFNYSKGFKITGVRAGEKINEFLISQDEGVRTVDMGGRYVIDSLYRSNKIYGGKKVPEGFFYDSKTNKEWISVKEMEKIIKEA